MMKKGALSLNNCQNLMDHEAFTAILGNNSVFYMNKGEVPNQRRLGETQEIPKLSESDKKLQEDNGVRRFTQARNMGRCITHSE